MGIFRKHFDLKKNIGETKTKKYGEYSKQKSIYSHMVIFYKFTTPFFALKKITFNL